ncbi:MAG: helix-turn-helix transcriptional regulator [Alphaproteobacteria bacterium]|nr:helix-turn-helix transcriptional regulator [Alphaproteobacteria bacterium]
MTPREIIDEIERLRMSAELTQAELATRIGLGSQQAWSHYARGKASSIPIDLIIRALGVFGRSLEITSGSGRTMVTDSEDGEDAHVDNTHVKDTQVKSTRGK